ncbi:LGFP repeat-containing protein [Nocardia sp. NPDC058497]|uniref:LGFP repeat-containing protein n=1 Tax=Nocardia sp. NPDC058497 TaxID=3346529 RepID=UPI00364DAAEA
MKEAIIMGDNQWHHNVPSIGDIEIAPGTSPTSWFTPTDVVQHIAYVGTDQHVHEAFYRYGGDNFWHHNVPSAADIQVAPGTSPTSWYTPSDDVQHIAYVGTDQQVHEAFYRLSGGDGQWHHNVPSIDETAVASGTSPSSWYTPNDNVQHIAYVGTDKQVHEAFYRLPDFTPELKAAERIGRKAANWAEGPPGDRTPLSATREAPGGGYVRKYPAGDIYYEEDSGAKWVCGDILQKYVQAGGSAALGFPLNDESSADGGGRFNAFQRGSIYFSSRTGAQVIRGHIFNHWLGLGAERSYLGYPFSGENPVPDPGTTWARFERGAVHINDANQVVFSVADTRFIRTGVIHVDGAAANGWAELTLSSSGAWRYNGSMRSTGALSYDVTMTSVVDLKASLGRGLAFVENGDVEGTLVLGGNRAHTWDDKGEDPFIRDNWDAIRGAKVISEFKVDFGPGDVLAIIATVIGVPLAAIGMAIGIALMANGKFCGYRHQHVWDPQRGEYVDQTGAVYVDKHSPCPPGTFDDPSKLPPP